MSEPTPFLQIVHISDLHIVAPGFRPDPDPSRFRHLLRQLWRVAPSKPIQVLDTLIRDGIAGHLPQARRAFASFLSEITTEDAQFQGLPTWLVQTGDLTTYGDAASIQLGLSFLNRLRHQTGVEVVSIHGNHDAWPRTLPICATSEIPQHETELHTFFPDDWPRPPLIARLPDHSGEVQLYGLNTVNPVAWANTWARGAIPREKLKALAQLVRAHAKQGEHQLCILVSHHPIRYPDPRPTYQMVLQNQNRACTFLKKGYGKGGPPLAHLILSGHTHQLSPPMFTLPATMRAYDQLPLGDEQGQLVVGSLSQLDPERKHGDLAHQCQILRFYYDSSEPGIVLMQRLPVARRSGQGAGRGIGFGRYEIIDEQGQNGAESIQTMAFEF